MSIKVCIPPEYPKGTRCLEVHIDGVESPNFDFNGRLNTKYESHLKSCPDVVASEKRWSQPRYMGCVTYTVN